MADPAALPTVERAVAGLCYELDRVCGPGAEGSSRGAGCANEPPKLMSYVTPAYRGALWIVVLLNVGSDVIEAVGGFRSGSQALKADALDFLGDGLITFLGVLAIGWRLVWRARSAMIQAGGVDRHAVDGFGRGGRHRRPVPAFGMVDHPRRPGRPAHDAP